MTIIDLATVKANLGISDTTYDVQISAQIPIIDAKVKQICNNNFNNQITLTTISGSPYAEISGLWYWWGGLHRERQRNDPMLKEIVKDIPVGTYLEGESIPRTSILESYYDFSATFSGTSYGAPFVKMSENATTTNAGAQSFYGWNKAYDSVVSKGIWYLIGQTSMTIDDGSWSTKKYGPVSITKGSGASDTKMDLKSGMPLWFVKALPRYH